MARPSRHDGHGFRRIVEVENHANSLIGARRLAGDGGHNGDLVSGWSEDGLEAPGDAGSDTADRGCPAPTVKSGGGAHFVRRFLTWAERHDPIVSLIEVAVLSHQTAFSQVSSSPLVL